ncbi:RHS repeat-associated core domain-containing protein [Pseudomonas kurunegalensis]|uniref:RHS repeat-associated core domain-containing protein n=1 Tax=Pseudomonas kurunegalensis TaxID=485880 RepID=UPI00236377CE|nr:RHS repeat-associated core domain-containing protein [Pseudomonas kurunegalensis]MDD2135031.1 RHS repeat-associated core domain-containing protein [Pseudomonas kurunegalensis]
MSSSLLYFTDQAGTLLGTAHHSHTINNVFSAYGHNANEILNAIGFKAERYDPLARGYFLGNGHRLYMTGVMRFCRPDISSPFGLGGINSYAYCAGDPINYFDPTGKSRTPLWRLRKATTKHIKSKNKTHPLPEANSSITQKLAARPIELADLPNEMINSIIGHLPQKDQLSFSQTSSRHRELVLTKNEKSISEFKSKYTAMGEYKKSKELLKLTFTDDSTPHTNLIDIGISKAEAIRKTTPQYPVAATRFQPSYGR